jgi:hypothetical protein
MNIKEETLYKYFKVILLNSEIPEPNSSMNILHEKYLKPLTEEERNEYFSISEGIIWLGVKQWTLKDVTGTNYDLTIAIKINLFIIYYYYYYYYFIGFAQLILHKDEMDGLLRYSDSHHVLRTFGFDRIYQLLFLK